jgi:hypothetical protein
MAVSLYIVIWDKGKKKRGGRVVAKIRERVLLMR